MDRITCEEAFRKLDDYVDREFSAEDAKRVEAHLAVCKACAAEYRFEASLLAGLRNKLAHIRLPQHAIQQIFENIDASESADEAVRQLDPAKALRPKE